MSLNIEQASGVARNLLLIPSVLVTRLQADPAVLILLASRRFPSTITLPLLRNLARVFNTERSWSPALYEAAAGKTDPLQERAEQALELPRTERNARFLCKLADTCVSVGLGDEAQQLLDQLNNKTSYARRAKARLAAWRGELSDAIELLDPSVPGEGYQRRLLEAEYASLTTSSPKIEAERGYSPIKGRVLHVLTNSLPHSRSGYAYRTQAILEAQLEAGLEPQAVTRLGYPALVGQFFAPSYDEIEGIRYYRQTPLRMRLGLEAKLQQSAEMLAEHVRSFRPAVLHTTTHYVNALVVRAVAEAFGIPWVYEVRGQLADTWASNRGTWAYETERYKLFNAREAEMARTADAVVTLGEHMKQNLIRVGVDPNNICLCPNAVGQSYTAEPHDTHQARHELGLDPQAQYVGSVTSVVGYEGLDDLLRAAALLAPEFPRLRVLIAGDGAALESLKNLAASLGIADRVQFAGRVEKKLAPLYQAALDVFVVPRKDTLVTRSVTPLKSVEASALGKPVIVSDIPALHEVVKDQETGLVATAENPESFARAIAELLENPDTAGRLGSAGREWVLETRTWTVNAGTYLGLYRQLDAVN
ncbi:glycosyltransferase family 4 protein [Micrococcoides hystricis]|uniref:Glycosyltransferase family 4 protein n=1 Tax=Micrococcoides hystricis TaxID=1572761 RepID=A0ABV6PC56_9MICC